MKKNAKSVHALLGVTGSIAAYKAADLVRRMKDRGWDVTVLMTRSALEFVGELTFRTLSRNKVITELFPGAGDWVPEHISLADRADVLVIAPCTANVLAKLAHGIADDILTCTALACDCPLVVAPAMNSRMWNHPATVYNVEVLKSRGATVVNVGTGELACGERGSGRMAEPDVIIKAMQTSLARRRKKG